MAANPPESRVKKLAVLGALGVFVIMALEVMIMISPFAFFFYSVFSPLFNFLGQHDATKWLTAFFLPHMILPPTLFLKAVRVLGSVFFLAGLLIFALCAGQVYLGKLFRWGIASRGLYRYVRHPQYLALGVWGTGMAILWPRFIVLASLSLMFVLYYFLARDEERRMLGRYGESYERYKDRTGAFFPRALERPGATLLNFAVPQGARPVVIPLLIFTLTLGSGFLLRAFSLASLPLAAVRNLTLVPILPEDARADAAIMAGILKGEETGAISFLRPDKSYLGYVMPVDYVMQGMIADTGGNFHLFKHHHTVALIADWVLHPFAHLRQNPMAHMAAMHGVDPEVARRRHCPLGKDQAGLDCATCDYRRIILVEVEKEAGGLVSGSGALSLEVRRIPVGYVDLDTATGQLAGARRVGAATAWKDVPTPEI